MLKENKKENFIYLSVPDFEKCGAKGIFSTRLGGVSSKEFTSMNLGYNRGDTVENVNQNFKTVADVLDCKLEDFVLSSQIHKDDIVAVDLSHKGVGISKKGFESADALITNQKGVALVIVTADCVPILFCDTEKKVIAAAHAGWRGTVLNIASKVVSKMVKDYSCNVKDIHCAIGPCIGKCHFEIGSDVADVLKENESCKNFVFPMGEKFTADLTAINNYQLINSGILHENIQCSNECTVCKSDKYFSHRVMGSKRGTNASFVIMTERS